MFAPSHYMAMIPRTRDFKQGNFSFTLSGRVKQVARPVLLKLTVRVCVTVMAIAYIANVWMSASVWGCVFASIDKHQRVSLCVCVCAPLCIDVLFRMFFVTAVVATASQPQTRGERLVMLITPIGQHYLFVVCPCADREEISVCMYGSETEGGRLPAVSHCWYWHREIRQKNGLKRQKPIWAKRCERPLPSSVLLSHFRWLIYLVVAQ